MRIWILLSRTRKRRILLGLMAYRHGCCCCVFWVDNDSSDDDGDEYGKAKREAWSYCALLLLLLLLLLFRWHSTRNTTRLHIPTPKAFPFYYWAVMVCYSCKTYLCCDDILCVLVCYVGVTFVIFCMYVWCVTSWYLLRTGYSSNASPQRMRLLAHISASPFCLLLELLIFLKAFFLASFFFGAPDVVQTILP